MRGKITVIGEAEQAATDLEGDGRADVRRLTTSDPALLAGSDVVVVGGSVDVGAVAGDVARRAPAAVLVVATPAAEGDVAVALERSLLPRPRVFGVAAGDAAAAAEAVLYGREAELECWVLCRGEQGVDDRVARVQALVGAGGLLRIGGGD